MGIFGDLKLRNKIFLYLFSFMALLLGGSMLLVRHQATRAVRETIERDLTRSAAYVSSSYASEMRSLEAKVRSLVSAAPYLRALLSDIRDPQTIVQWAAVQARESLHVPFLMVADGNGIVLARVHAPLAHSDELPPESPFWRTLDEHVSTRALVSHDGKWFDAVAVPVLEGAYAAGILIAGREVGTALAVGVREQTDCDVAFIAGGRTLASTLTPTDAAELESETFAARKALMGLSGDIVSFHLGSVDYRGIAGGLTEVADTESFGFVLFRSVDALMAPYTRIQRALALIGLLSLVGALAASLFLAQSITKPVSLLVDGARAVQNGDYQIRLEISSKDEIGVLAGAFNEMIQGLREKIEMNKFVSASTREMISRATAERKNERARMTLLFSDIRGFTSLSEKLPPEEVVAFVNHALSVQSDIVKKFGGDIDKFVGDELIAVFKGDDMVLRAIRCAVEIQKTPLGHVVVDGETRNVRVGVGINTGEVLHGSVGNQERKDYTILGSPVNLCARLCSAAEAGEIVFSEEAYREVSDLVKAEKMEPLAAKGFAKPVPIYRIRVEQG